MDNNPLRQYFRRPAVYIKLPSDGDGYPEGSLDMPENRELPVYPMTAIDEITTRTPDALANGTAVAELIRSCIPNIKDPWVIPNVDLDAILVAIKTASSSSGEMEIESMCPKCEDISQFKINLIGLLSNISKPNFDKELEIGDLSVKIRPLTFKEVNAASMEQFEFQRIANQIDSIEDDMQRARVLQQSLEKITDLTMELVSSSIDYIKTPTSTVDQKEFILDFLKHCDRNIYITIRDYSSELRQVSEVKPVKIKCANCANEYDQAVTLNPTDFFE